MDVPVELRRKMIITLIEALRESPSFKNIQLAQLKEAVLNSENQTFMQAKNREEYVYYIHEKLKKIQDASAQKFEFRSERGAKVGYSAEGADRSYGVDPVGGGHGVGMPSGPAHSMGGPHGSGPGIQNGVSPGEHPTNGHSSVPLSNAMVFNDGDCNKSYNKINNTSFGTPNHGNAPHSGPSSARSPYGYGNTTMHYPAGPSPNYANCGFVPGQPVNGSAPPSAQNKSFGGKFYNGNGAGNMGMMNGGIGGQALGADGTMGSMPIERIGQQGGVYAPYMGAQASGMPLGPDAGVLGKPRPGKGRGDAPMSNQLFIRQQITRQGGKFAGMNYPSEYSTNRSFIGNVKGRAYTEGVPEGTHDGPKDDEYFRGMKEPEPVMERGSGGNSGMPSSEQYGYRRSSGPSESEALKAYANDFFKSESLFGDINPTGRGAKQDIGAHASQFGRQECNEKPMPREDGDYQANNCHNPQSIPTGFKIPQRGPPGEKQYGSVPVPAKDETQRDSGYKEAMPGPPYREPAQRHEASDYPTAAPSPVERQQPVSFLPPGLEAFLKTRSLRLFEPENSADWSAKLAQAYKAIGACSDADLRQLVTMQWKFPKFPFLDTNTLAKAMPRKPKELLEDFDYSDYFERSISAFESIKAINKDSVFQLSSDENE